MSKLDNIILECANRVLDGKEEKLGDYIDPTKQQIKDLMLEIVGTNENESQKYITARGLELLLNRNSVRTELRKKVEELW